MARVVSFEIRGLAGRRGVVRHRLQPDVNVFWGRNGCGKTSLLKILHSALSDDATSILRVPFTSATIVIQDDSRDVLITRRIDQRQLLDAAEVRADLAPDVWALYQKELRASLAHGASQILKWDTEPFEDGIRPLVFRHGYLPISRISEARSRRGRLRGSAAELVDEATFDRLFAEQVQDLWVEYSQRASIQIRSAQERGLARILNSVLSSSRHGSFGDEPAYDADEAYKLVKSFFANQRLGTLLHLGHDSFVRNYRSSSLAQEVVAELAEVQLGIDAAQVPQARIEDLLADLYSGGKRVVLHGREVTVDMKGQPVPLESLSSGEKQLLQLLLECLAAGANPVIIDEPELSLHVDWQRRLIACMRLVGEDSQLIMATHAPEVVAALPDQSLIEL